jgi:hypothetical protein
MNDIIYVIAGIIIIYELIKYLLSLILEDINIYRKIKSNEVKKQQTPKETLGESIERDYWIISLASKLLEANKEIEELIKVKKYIIERIEESGLWNKVFKSKSNEVKKK